VATETAAVVAYAMHRHAGLRLFLQHGFMNYYLSLGLACFGLAILWRGNRIAWIGGVAVAALTLLAHPIGFLWLAGTFRLFQGSRENVGVVENWLCRSQRRAGFPRFTCTRRTIPRSSRIGNRGPFYLYKRRGSAGALRRALYLFLAGAAFIFGLICLAADFYGRRHEATWWKPFQLPFELYVVTFLRDGAAARKSAAFALRRLDWTAQFTPYHDFPPFSDFPCWHA